MAARYGDVLQTVHESDDPILRSRRRRIRAEVVGRSVAASVANHTNTTPRCQGHKHYNNYPATRENCGIGETGGIPIMEPNADQPKAPESKPVSKPESKDDLNFLPMPELQAKLGSSRNGLSQAEAQKR